MRLERVEVALTQCRSHLKDLPLASVAIRSLLVQALLILICAELERVIREQITAKCSDIKDPELARFVETCADRVTRGLTINELTRLLKRFDVDFGKDFQKRLRHDPETSSMYASLIQTRNGVAHGEDLPATLADIVEYYRHALIVLEHFRNTLLRKPITRRRERGSGPAAR